MKFYRINNSLDSNIMGVLPQINDYKYYSDIDNPKFIGRIHFQKTDFEPIPVSPILKAKANKTDLIESGGQLALKILISSKLKSFLQRNDSGVQYFCNPIFHDGIEDNGYFVVNPYSHKNEWIDFEKSSVYYRKYNPDRIEDFKILNLSKEEFDSLYQNKDMFDEIYLYQFTISPEKADKDFFIINKSFGGLSFIVSEKLKNEIESSGCTGIEFQPTELSYDEWITQEGPRDKIYGRSW